MSKQQVLADIKAYVAQGGGSTKTGTPVASDPRDRLFNGHSIKEKSDYWIFRTSDSSEDARAVEDELFRLGAKGGPGGGDNTTKAVYAYKIASHTTE